MTTKCKKADGCEFAKLVPICATPCPPFKIDEADAALYDHFAQESVYAHGTELLFWHQDLHKSRRDPLYDEPIDRDWRGPFTLNGFVTYMESTPQMREEGLVIRWEGEIWVARKELEDKGAPIPTEGDVFKFWENRFFTEYSVAAEEGVPNAGYYFDVIHTKDDGHIGDTAYFVGISLRVIRRTEFTPERRLGA